MEEIKPLTQSYPAIIRAVYSRCGLSQPLDINSGSERPEVKKFVGLWDTGAAITTITENVVKALGLTHKGFTRSYHAQGSSIAKVYKVAVYLPNGSVHETIDVMEGCLPGFDVLIGMDLISKGDLVITNRDGKTVFSFQTPSTHLYDFEKQLAAAQPKAKRKKK